MMPNSLNFSPTILQPFNMKPSILLAIIFNQTTKKNNRHARPNLHKNNLLHLIKKINPKNHSAFTIPQFQLTHLRQNNMHDHSGINFPKKSDYLSITIEAELKDTTEIEISINQQNMIARHKAETITVPTNIHKQKWIKINFGQEYRKVTLRPATPLKKIERKLVFTDRQSWKQQQKQQVLNCYHISIQSILFLLKSKIDKQEKHERKTEMQYKNSISGFMKSKFSERGNLKSHNAISKRSEHVIFPREEQEKKQISTVGVSRARRHDSQTLEIQNALEEDKDKERRESNASTSIRVESRDIKFSKRIKKLRELAQTKNTFSQKQTLLDDTSDLFPLTKMRPRFYQHINLSQEQIDLKRRKFDSQFITKKSTTPTTQLETPEKQPNQSQVTQDICKMEGSKSIPPVEDTLQRGIALNQQPPAQQSGTLCQSVYQ